MSIEALVISKIMEKIFSYSLDKGQNVIEKWAHDKLGLEPRKQAFKSALEKAYSRFEKNYPQWTAELFNSSFLENEGAPVLAQFLIRDGYPNSSDLANLWAASLNINQVERRTILVRELEPAATDFLNYMATALKSEQALIDLNDCRALERIVDDMESLRKRFNAELATPGTRQDYLHWLIERNLYLDPRGTFQTQRQVQLKLDEIYISLHALHDETPSAVDRRVLEDELVEIKAKAVQTRQLRLDELKAQQNQPLTDIENYYLLYVAPESEDIFELVEAVNRYNQLVIMGDPGSGKSTLLRYLTLSHAQALWNNQTEVDTTLGAACFPIMVRIADYAEFGMPYGKSLSDFLAEYCVMHECPKAGLTDLLATELARGNCIVLFDGLDEIVSADERRKVVERIEDFVRRYNFHSNRFVITSRIVGYRSAPLSKPFAHFIVQEMDDKQIRQFLDQWCVAVEASQTPELSQEARRIVAQREIEAIMNAIQTSPGVRRLAGNPLLLRILALIHRTGAHLPQKRIELYRLAADTLARTWRMASGVPESALVKEEYLTPLLSNLAYWLHYHKPTGTATEREVYNVLGEEWANLNDLHWDVDRPNPRIKEEVEKFLVGVREHTGLFVERAPGHYGFMHLTFEEYYAARYLVARSKTRAKLIRQHLHNPRWDEPILLALAFMSFESRIESQELLETAILAEGSDAETLGIVPSLYEGLLGRDYLFALGCLGDNIPTRPRIMQKLLRRMANELLNKVDSGRFQHYMRELEEKLENLRDSEAASQLSLLFITNLNNTSNEIRLRAVICLGYLGVVSPEVVDALVSILYNQEETTRVRRAAVLSLGSLGQTSSAVVEALLCTLQDSDSGVRFQAVISLGYLGNKSDKVVSVLLHALLKKNPEVRLGAIESLGRVVHASDVVVNALLQILSDSDPKVRRVALESLERLGNTTDKVVNAVLKALSDTDTQVRRVALESLGGLDRTNDEVIKKMLIASQDSDSSIRHQAVDSIGRLGLVSPEVLKTLQIITHDEDTWVRLQATDSLSRLGRISNDALDLLIGNLSDNDPWIRVQAAGNLGGLKLASDKVVAVLVKALEDSDPDVRYKVVESLGQIGNASNEVINSLIEGLLDKDVRVCRIVAKCLGQLSQQSDDVINALSKALDSEDLELRFQAAVSLGQLEFVSDRIVSILIKALFESKSWLIRRNAALLIGQIGHAEASTIKSLIHGLLDKDNDVRTICAESLAQLGQRFPKMAKEIADNLEFAVTDPTFNKLDSHKKRAANDYAFDGLWTLVVSGVIEESSSWIPRPQKPESDRPIRPVERTRNLTRRLDDY